MRINPVRPLTWAHLIAIVCFTFGTVSLLPRTAVAQDHLALCTSAGLPVTCCKESYAKHGPFGTARGPAKQAREADMAACQARIAKAGKR